MQKRNKNRTWSGFQEIVQFVRNLHSSLAEGRGLGRPTVWRHIAQWPGSIWVLNGNSKKIEGKYKWVQMPDTRHMYIRDSTLSLQQKRDHLICAQKHFAHLGFQMNGHKNLCVWSGAQVPLPSYLDLICRYVYAPEHSSCALPVNWTANLLQFA